MGTELGINQEDPAVYSNNILDYNKIINSNNFTAGIERLKNGIFKGYTIAIMCTEKDPIDCHRSVLVGEDLNLQCYNVLHILDDGKIESHKEFLDRAIDLYYPDRMQQNIFELLVDKNYNSELTELVCRRRYHDLVNKL
jgi:uncharacterized protein (DUF488 family)